MPASIAARSKMPAGFSRVGEFHYLHHDIDGRPYSNIGEMAERIAAAAKTTGIGLTLLPVDYPADDGLAARALVTRARRA